MRKPRPTHADRAESYAKDVVAGRVLACELVKRACKRHLSDLKSQAKRAFPYRFDPAKTNKVCGFLELLPHVKGQWARDKERIRLEDWQCFAFGVPFGWLRKKDGLRRYRRVYIEVPRKNAKSTATAGLGLYMFAADGEAGAEVYSGAGSEKQAWEVFGPARLMAKGTPELRDHFGIEVGAKNLHIMGNASKFEPIIGKPGDGASPSFSITDEYHEHVTEEQYDTMVTGMGSREQPMAWVITTAGSSIEGPCYALRSEVVSMLTGTVPNDELWGLVYTIDEGMDWTTPEALRMANPNLGVSVREDYLLAQQRDAINNPRKQSTFKTKHLNVWVTAASPFFNHEQWVRLGDSTLKEADFAGQPCWIGLDLAAKLDLAAVVKVFRRDIERQGVTEPHYYAFGRFYLPETRAEDPAVKHYAEWHKTGALITTMGNVTDYDAIEDDLRRDAELFRIVKVGFDPWGATQLVAHLMADGIPCMEVPQTVKHVSDPMKWVEALIVDGRLHHQGNPLFGWAMANVTAQEDRNGNVFPRKEHVDKKIDPAVALIMAIGFAQSEDDGRSVYEGRGIDFVAA